MYNILSYVSHRKTTVRRSSHLTAIEAFTKRHEEKSALREREREIREKELEVQKEKLKMEKTEESAGSRKKPRENKQCSWN